MPAPYQLADIARLPMPGDNTAIATRRLEAGELVWLDGAATPLSHTVLEGHRFAVRPLAAGELLLSWRLPFGAATRPIAAGEYVCNAQTLKSLRNRSIVAALPDAPNFVDRAINYTLDPTTFQPAPPTPRLVAAPDFLGYRRSPARGVGTRNFIVLIGASSATGSFVRALEDRLKGAAANYANIDGIVAVAHTEGSVPHANNRAHVLRTLAGFIVHANVGAALVVDAGWEPINNAVLRAFMHEHGYPLHETPHTFMSIQGAFEANLTRASAIVTGWLETVNATPRTPASAAQLKIALQCGGSDAFSGVSANPLIGWAAHRIVGYGGYANIAETPELIGAEPYMLDKVRDLATAQRYLAIRDRFVAYAAAHGASAEGNPSDGNKLRGLYNIILKSIGAAMKKHPDTRLDYAIDYSDRMTEPGFYFMDSPGLDLESVAGQVAAGCNVIYFTTGNGSVTNFPFVPTIKVVTTTPRFTLLAKDMDVNAGAYLDGVDMETLGEALIDLTLRVASGERTAGERAGHAQVQIWRNWRQGGEGERSGDGEIGESRLELGAASPLTVRPPARRVEFVYSALESAAGPVFEQVGLIVPTSLCAAQVARLAADRLNRRRVGIGPGRSRYVALVHTEGCSDATGEAITMSAPTLLGYATHRMAGRTLLLEHGCEVTHNDFMRRRLTELGYDLEHFGWASVQLDGGIASVLDRIEAWFAATATDDPAPRPTQGGLSSLHLALLATAPLAPDAATALAEIVANLVAVGGTVVVAQSGYLLHTPAFVDAVLAAPYTLAPTLAYSGRIAAPGLHIMATPTDHPVEIITGLGATGVDAVLAYVGAQPVQGHPLVPVLEIATVNDCPPDVAAELDLVLAGDPTAWAAQILARLSELAAHRYIPNRIQTGNIDFQITRGLMGISL
ncbi:MAG TPA: altronate dehydratase [Chloroflexi bacterium]|nr:altronate dehydratase [Chloroflexota bacterium]